MHSCLPRHRHRGAIASFDTFTEVMLQVEVFWVVTPCDIVVGYQCIRGPWRWRQHGFLKRTKVYPKFLDWPPGARTANNTAVTRCSCTATLWVSLVSFAAITLCVASQWVIVFIVYFVIDSVRKLLDTPSYMIMSLNRTSDRTRIWQLMNRLKMWQHLNTWERH
jgi:hypothetical protein